ncbi:hypothetical protein [Sphingomicrobium nitratireducens]|uniref:hypothetical protein n=1 Tax=Sphingomicrobium nitratireducens TaxID=2964666 RepID=UPI002240CD9C|nr:hypothetical protein [Sphingomicrobium nitratireducens]
MFKFVLVAAAPLIALGVAEPLTETPKPQPLKSAQWTPKKACPDARLSQAEKGERPIRVDRLADLPPARHEKAVHYSEDGCVKPVVVSENVEKSRR